jgi:hypothetical protein
VFGKRCYLSSVLCCWLRCFSLVSSFADAPFRSMFAFEVRDARLARESPKQDIVDTFLEWKRFEANKTKRQVAQVAPAKDKEEEEVAPSLQAVHDTSTFHLVLPMKATDSVSCSFSRVFFF